MAAESKSDRLTLAEIETAVNQCATANENGSFRLTAVLKELDAGRATTLQSRIDRIILGDERFFSDGAGSYQLRKAFFTNYEFLITPDTWEIDNGILFPGHRFCAYVAPEVFPSEVVMTESGTHIPTVKENLTAPLSQIFHYHLLLGSEQIFDFLIADSPANARLRRSQQPTESVTLNVYNLKEFYRKNEFALGDALLCKVLDYEHGVIEYRMLSGSERREKELQDAVQTLENAIRLVVERFETYLDIPEQLAWSCYCGRDLLCAASHSASLDEFLQRTTEVEINTDGDHTVLALRNAVDDDHYDPDLPEGLRFSRGETGEIGAMLKEVGSPLTPLEVDSFILDNCYARELEFEDFFARAFGREKLQFADEGQQAAFYNYIEDRFEELTENYNRVDDELKAPLRSSIMELVEDRLAFLDFLASIEEKISDLPHEKVHRLAEISQQLNEILRMLNNPAYTPAAEELDQLSATIENRVDDQERLIAELTDHFEDNSPKENL